MTAHDGNSPVRAPARRLRFDGYVLDLDRGCLLLDGKEVTLRPKTLAVLHYLVENHGRLVPKDDLFAAVWPNLAITDDVLVQSVGELRRALGEDGPNGQRQAEVTPVPSASDETAQPRRPGSTARIVVFAALAAAVLVAGVL